MALNSNTLSNPSDHSEPNPLLPDEVIGHIDLETLANIHQYLRESVLQEDIELATWMWENYLNGVWNGSSTAEIRTAQAFGKLDRAYRRVRSLTNKAQDKWPFFDRNFKQMSSAMVRNNARGEAAPGVMYPIDGLQRKSHLTGLPPNGSTTPNASFEPELRVPFNTTAPISDQSNVQNHSRPTRQTSVPPSPSLFAKSSGQMNTETQDITVKQPLSSVAFSQNIYNHTAQDTSDSDGQAMPQSGLPQSESPQSDVHQIEGAFDQVTSQDDLGASLSASFGDSISRRSSPKPIGDLELERPVRDAGAGKIRGPNGRYIPRADTTPGSKKTNKPKSGGKAQKSMRTLEKTGLPVPKVVTEDEGTLDNAQSPSPAMLSRETEGQQEVQDKAGVFPVSPVVAPPTTVDKSESKEEEAALHPGSVPAYLLAAEADAVPSNLDRLPPNSRRSNKRKSEPTLQSEDRKRGKHGGIVGRPRKSEQRKDQEPHPDPASPQEETAIDAATRPQMTTRRATRQSAARNLGTPISSKPLGKTQPDVPAEQSTLPPKKSQNLPQHQGKPSTDDEDRAMSGLQEDVPVAQGNVSTLAQNSVKVSTTPSSTSEIPSPPLETSTNHLLSLGTDGTISPALSRPSSRLQSYQSPHEPVPLPPSSAPVIEETINKRAKSVNLPGHVEYFARITTGNGDTMDLPIEEDRLDSDEVEMIENYARYNAKPGVKLISYTEFRDVFAFAKQH